MSVSVLCVRVTTWINTLAKYLTGDSFKRFQTDLTFAGLPAEFKHISKQRKRY